MGMTAGFQKGQEQDFQGDCGPAEVDVKTSVWVQGINLPSISRWERKKKKVITVVGDPKIHLKTKNF